MFKIELNGEIAIVTGAARGIGKALAESLFGADASVFAVDKIDTTMLDLMPQAQKQKLMQRIPLRRIGIPQDIIGLALLLASEAGSYITGQTFHINGGMYMN